MDNKLFAKRVISSLTTLSLLMLFVSPFLSVKANAAPLLNFGTWTDVTGTTTITFDSANALAQSDTIVFTFPSDVTVGAGSNITLTCNSVGTTATASTTDHTVTVTVTDAGGCTDTGNIVAVSTNFVSTDVSTPAQYAVAINTNTSGGTNNEWGVALKTSDNTTNVTAQVLDTVTLTVDTTTVALGVITPSSAPVATTDQTYTLSSNVTDGLALQLARTSNGLYNGAHSWTAASGSACAAGTECYGISLDAASNFTIAGSYATPHQAIPASATTVATTSGPQSSATVDVNYVATSSDLTPSGNYSDTITATLVTTP